MTSVRAAVSSIRIGTRGSALARWQAEHVAARLREASPGLQVELRIIKTTGDKILDVPLAKVGGKGLFVKEIEEALQRHEVDLAVHSIKDVPTELVSGLGLAAIPEREDPRDALCSRLPGGLAGLPRGARVGTSSLRRRCQLLHLRPDLEILELRGNVDTRLGKLDAGSYDAVVLAAAGLRRLGRIDRASELLEPETMLPAVGQGALGLETRLDDRELNLLCEELHHAPTGTRVRAERALLARLGGGCQVPVAAHARIEEGALRLDALIGHPSGEPFFRDLLIGELADPEALGAELAGRLLARGADRVLAEVYGSPGSHD
jgi:hydroxymethylbilane synthase